MMRIQSDPHVYGPEDDSYLLLEALTQEMLSGRGLEIGVGTGVIALNICHHFEEFEGVDINPRAVELARTNAHLNNLTNILFFESDLFSEVSGNFDCIIFNPPYVPADEDITDIDALSYHGGDDGRQVLDHFLSEVSDHLNPNGKVYVLHSSLSDIEKTCSMLDSLEFAWDIIARKRLFFEELVVFKIQRKEE